MLKNDLLFARKNEDVILPTKRNEDAAYDIYAYFEEESLVINPGEIKLIPTGLYSVCSSEYYIQLGERGSTGTNGLSLRAGIIDSGFRGEWFIPINNTTNRKIIITKEVSKVITLNDILLYPYSKAIASALVIPVPKMNVKEITLEELKNYNSERGTTALGASGK